MSSLFDPGPPRNGRAEGGARRYAALALLRARRSVLIREMQTAALRIALESGEVTADDVRPLVMIPADIKPAFVGVVFKDLAHAGILRHSGIYRRSCRPVAHARPNPIWRLADAAGASAWLAADRTATV